MGLWACHLLRFARRQVNRWQSSLTSWLQPSPGVHLWAFWGSKLASELQSKVQFYSHIGETERTWSEVFVPACPRGPSKVSPSMKLAVIAASFLPSVIISPRFWNLQNIQCIWCLTWRPILPSSYKDMKYYRQELNKWTNAKVSPDLNLNGRRGRSLIAAQRFHPAKSACWKATWEMKIH